MEVNKSRKDFFDKVAKILGTTHEYVEPRLRKTRWNARNNGNGCYPGFGTVRHFGAYIYVMLNNPLTVTQKFDTEVECFEFLEEIMK